MALLQSQKNEDLLAKIASLEAELAKAKANGSARVTMKISEKGALSVYGLGRFPVTLYRSQWERLLGMADAINGFIKDNASKLAVKD